MITNVETETQVLGATVTLTALDRTRLLAEIEALFPRLHGGTTIAVLYNSLRPELDRG